MFEQELCLIRPAVLICPGVTAASAVLGRRVTQGTSTFVTIHPSAILRRAARAAGRTFRGPVKK